MKLTHLLAHKSLKIVRFFVVLFLMACSTPPGKKFESPVPKAPLLGTEALRHDLLRINSLTLLPIEFDEGIRQQVTKGAGFYDLLGEVAHRELQLEFVHGDAVLSQYADGSPKHSKNFRLSVGKKLGTDGVVFMRLHEYVERLGSKIGANRPAQVDFTMGVLRVKDGAEVWSATYHVKEEALSENLFSLQPRVKEGRSGASWDSAHDILERGFRDAFRDFEEKRTREFMMSTTR